MVNNESLYSIGDVSARTGLSVHALRYYEREQLLIGPVERSSSGRRLYSQVDVDWLEIVTKLRGSGMPLEQLRRFVALVRLGPGNEADRLNILREHRERVRRQVRELEECLSVIDGKVGTYETHVEKGRAVGLWDPSTGRP